MRISGNASFKGHKEEVLSITGVRMKLTERQEMSGRGVTSVKAGDQLCRMGIRIVGGTGLIVLNDCSGHKIEKSGKKLVRLEAEKQKRQDQSELKGDRDWLRKCLLNERRLESGPASLPGKALSGTSRAYFFIFFLLIVFTYTWLSWLFSSCGARASHCGGPSPCGAGALGHKGLR